MSAMVLESCSPFGTQSLVEEISSSIINFFDGKTSPSLISGSSSTATPAIPTAGDATLQTGSPSTIPPSNTPVDLATAYKVSQTIGEAYQYAMEDSGGASFAPAVKTGTDSNTHVDTGYKVYSTVK